MAGIKYEEEYKFPDGHIWLLMDDEWGVEITGEEGFGGALVGMQSWDFSTHESWIAWGEYCMERLAAIEKSQDVDEIYTLDEEMGEDIKQYVLV